MPMCSCTQYTCTQSDRACPCMWSCMCTSVYVHCHDVLVCELCRHVHWCSGCAHAHGHVCHPCHHMYVCRRVYDSSCVLMARRTHLAQKIFSWTLRICSWEGPGFQSICRTLQLSGVGQVPSILRAVFSLFLDLGQHRHLPTQGC